MVAFSVTHDFSGGTTAVASQVNTNFDDVETEINNNCRSRFVLLHSGTVTSTSTSEETMDTHDLGVNDLSADDELFIYVLVDDHSSGGTGTECSIDITDSTETKTIGAVGTKKVRSLSTISLFQLPEDNTDMHSHIIRAHTTGNVTTTNTGLGFNNDANMITTALTIDLRGYVETGGTMYASWWIYRRDHE